MTITLPTELARTLLRQLRTGRYTDPVDVLASGLELLVRREELWQAITLGHEEAAAPVRASEPPARIKSARPATI